MNPTFYSTFLLALVLSAVAGQDDGVCVKPQTFNQTLDTERVMFPATPFKTKHSSRYVANFLFQYSGRWYLQLQIPAWFSPDGISCATANYEPNGTWMIDSLIYCTQISHQYQITYHFRRRRRRNREERPDFAKQRVQCKSFPIIDYHRKLAKQKKKSLSQLGRKFVEWPTFPIPRRPGS